MIQQADFLQQVNKYSEQTVELCYHCHKCTSGCPVADEMQYGPDRILRMVQMGETAALLSSADIWVCASCETCGVRCPNEIDIALVMDALRQIAYQSRAAVGDANALKFHKSFLFLTKNLGRMHEATLMGIITLWTRNLMTDIGTILKMLVKGKAPLLPKPVRQREQIRRIFERTQHSDGDEG